MKIARGMEGFNPEIGWEICVREKGEYDLVKSTNHTFGFPILLGSVRAREAKMKTVCFSKRFEILVIEFTPYVTLESFNFEIELGLDVFMKLRKFGKSFRLEF